MMQELTLNETNKSGSHLLCRLLMRSDPCSRLSCLVSNSSWEKISLGWGGEGYFCRCLCHWLDVMRQMQTLHLLGWARSCRYLCTSNPVSGNDLLDFRSGCSPTWVLNFTFAWKMRNLEEFSSCCTVSFQGVPFKGCSSMVCVWVFLSGIKLKSIDDT